MKVFKILGAYSLGDLTTVPWDFVAPHEKQAIKNHCGQTLIQLNERGGLSIQELYYVIFDQKFSRPIITEQEALKVVLAKLEEWNNNIDQKGNS